MKLELCYNQISGGLHFLNQYPLLRILKLRNNQIKTFETLAPLKKNNLLNDLDLFDNPVTELPKYRSTVFELLEQIQVLDFRDKFDLDKYSENGESCKLDPNIEEDDDEFDEAYLKNELQGSALIVSNKSSIVVTA